MSKKNSTSWESLPVGRSPQPVPVVHFPDALHAVVWRNWDVVPLENLAEVLRASPAAIRELAASMGLRDQRVISPVEVRRNYMTILHRNWHLLPYGQLGALLGWTPARMQFGLNEDDFMWAKLGGYKPDCPPVHYRPPSAESRARAGEIAAIVANDLGSAWNAPAEPPFGFIQRFRGDGRAPVSASALEIRMVYPYFLRYGDPLLGEGVDDIPDGYLAELAESGVNAIWLQGILNTLAPWDLAPELSQGWEERLANLRKLVERAGKYGIQVLLYLNEPRGMPRSFFERHPELRGVDEMPSRVPYAPGVAALCVSTPPVKDFLVHSVRHIFTQVPGLGGILSLTYSENLTNCYSRTYAQKAGDGSLEFAFDPTSTDPRNRGQQPCPRCLEHGPEAINAEVCRLLERGMREAGSQGRLLLYLWSTPEQWIPGIMDHLPPETWVLCVSEWGAPFVRGDYHGKVNEYSISVVGPSDQSLRQWDIAHARHHRKVAKMQAANTYEFSSIPYIPALRLVAQHLANLTAAGVEGLMLGWTAGGSPSPNLELVSEFAKNPSVGVNAAMLAVAARRFGPEAAPGVVDAWNAFSDAYLEFPFDISVCYAGPQSLGPANLLYARPTGFRASMVTFPFDDLDGWRGPYSVETLQGQFAKVAHGWRAGLDILHELRRRHPSSALDDEWRVAFAAEIHFKSTVNQIRYIRARENDAPMARRLLEDEIILARELFTLVGADSRLGFEATNHYGYIRLDLAEKIINCRHLLSLT